MAQKQINELTLIDEATGSLMLPSDDGIQSYRVTAAQLKAYILANGNITLPMLDADLFTGLDAVTPADDDYFPLIDTSDANNTKKGLVGSFRKSVYRSVTTTDAVTATDETMKMSGASFNSTLPTAVGVAGKRYKYLHAGTSLTQVYTILTTSGQTVGGIASGSYALYTAGEVLEIESDGANWIVINHYANGANGTYTPTIVGFGTATNVNFRWARRGNRLRVEGYWTAGTVTATPGTISLPSGLTLDTSQMYANGAQYGSMYGNVTTTGTDTPSAAKGPFYVSIESGYTDKVGLGQAVDTNTPGAGPVFYVANVNAYVATGTSQAVTFEVPISVWQP